MKRNRIVCLVLSLTLLAGCFGNLSVSATMMNENIVVPQISYSTVEQKINSLRLDTSVYYTVSTHHILHSVSGICDYYYFKLSPFGYAIYDSMNFVLQEADLLAVDSPYCFDNANVVNYYAGPMNYLHFDPYTQNLENDSNDIMPIDALQNIIAKEISVHQTTQANVAAHQMSTTKPGVSIPTSTVYAYLPGYWSFIGNAFHNNTEGVCTLTAIQLLLSYYNGVLNTNYISDLYELGSGTNEDFFTLLALCAGIANNQSDTHYLYNRMGIEEGANALNFYLSYCTQIPVNAVYGCGNNDAVQQAVAQRIGMAMRPIIAAHFAAYPYNGDGNHTVIVYGYGADSVNGSTVYLCHNGAYGQHILWISASWFADYLYINN